MDLLTGRKTSFLLNSNRKDVFPVRKEVGVVYLLRFYQKG